MTHNQQAISVIVAVCGHNKNNANVLFTKVVSLEFSFWFLFYFLFFIYFLLGTIFKNEYSWRQMLLYTHFILRKYLIWRCLCLSQSFLCRQFSPLLYSKHIYYSFIYRHTRLVSNFLKIVLIYLLEHLWSFENLSEWDLFLFSFPSLQMMGSCVTRPLSPFLACDWTILFPDSLVSLAKPGEPWAHIG